MSRQPTELILSLTPTERFEITDIAAEIKRQYGNIIEDYRKTLCCSHHTTAGYIDQRLCAKLGYSQTRLDQFMRIFRKLYPPDAGYLHDCMPLRHELSESQKEREPLNADSHLTYMSAGLQNCVIYANQPERPIYFVELDGVYKDYQRERRTTVLAYDREEIVYQGQFSIPTAIEHTVNSFNLKDPQYGLFDHLNTLLEIYGIEKGRIDIRLAPEERHAGLTVNEYETMLMRNDLPEAIRNPLRYAIEHGVNLLRNPVAIPAKARDYVIYDLIHLYNELMDNVQIGRSAFNKVLSYLSAPAYHVFRLKRQVSLLVSKREKTTSNRIVLGTYQSPIMLQYQPTAEGTRQLEITLHNFV